MGGYGKWTPPGPGPHNGTDAVYGGRPDWGTEGGIEWGSVPSMYFRLVYNGYYTAGSVNGHPVIGTNYFFLATMGILFLARTGLFGLSALLVHTLWNSKIQGKYAHIMLYVYGVIVVWLFDYFGLWTVLHTRAPRGEQGFMNGNAAFIWWLYHTYLMWSTAKYGYRLNAAGRGVALPVATVVFISVFVQGFFWGILEKFEGKGLLLLRLVIWPIITELITAPIRAFLRGIPEEWADKAGVAYAMIPVSVCLAGLGRFFQYKILDTTDILLCNIFLFVIEILFRVSVAHRDRFYARMLGCMSSTAVKNFFSQKSNVKFRCDNLINEMAVEYWTMCVIFIQTYGLNRVTNPSVGSNGGPLLLNFFLQFFLELVCDTVCLYIEDNKLKAPVMKAWMGRKKHYPFLFSAFTIGFGMYVIIGPLWSVCPMRHPETGAFMGVSCYIND